MLVQGRPITQLLSLTTLQRGMFAALAAFLCFQAQ